MSEITLKVIVTGGSGLLGRAVVSLFKSNNELNEKENIKIKWNVIGLCYSREQEGLKKLDLTNFSEVNEFIEEFKPDAIIHCAAEKNVENVQKNPEKSGILNVGATENLAKTCAEKEIKFVYISTDYVFDGSCPPYYIDSATNPLNKYAETKLAGEKATLKHSQSHCVVRVPVLYGQTGPNAYHESAVNIQINAVRKGVTYSIDDAQIRYPTHVKDVARFLNALLKTHFQHTDRQSSPIKGIFHCSASEPLTKYEMSCHMADLFNLSKDHIHSDKSAESPTDGPPLRPMNPKLSTEYSYGLVKFQPIMKFKDSIKECLEQFI